MELKLWLSFLLLHVIHVQSSSGQWLANVPARIPVVQGSCVVIPCSFNYPRPTSKQILNRWKGFWKDGKKFVSTTIPKWKLAEEYRRRTTFLGDLAARNCSMLLDGVRNTDVGPFYFRIEMPHYTSYSYTMNPVHIDVLRKPTPPSLSAEVKAKVTAYCSVTHPCPTNAPEFSWSQSGTASRRSKKLNTWQWKTISTLTFRLRPTTSNQTLNCTVRYRGGKQATSSMILPI
ncbi:sialic acid-binding Ig-like lectin 14 [Cyclopterus lumpus]|uniref:sialic acid-binding Ig-like lectin 14 n=1 Tax=Cyclopterus lumpus TaxID=8103 RepID=UPI0014861CE0|nr:sialic acid-binding Ig-like lectin 14 [Cyclopterus lumpus]